MPVSAIQEVTRIHSSLRRWCKVKLSAPTTMDVPITWDNGRESIFTILVVLHLSWSILFGKNHLHATKSLVDHGQPSITFQHSRMQFTVPRSLDNPLTGFISTTGSGCLNVSSWISQSEASSTSGCIWRMVEPGADCQSKGPPWTLTSGWICWPSYQNVDLVP